MNATQLGSGFFARWVVHTIIGYAVGFAAGFLFGQILLGNVMVGMAMGAGAGYMQWRLLRDFVPSSSFWIVDCMTGMTVALALYTVVNAVWGYPFDLGVPHGAVGWMAAFTLAGALAGIFQYRILSRTIRRPLMWVPASALGWGLSIVGLAIPLEMEDSMPMGGVFPLNLLVAPVAAGLILGLVTGIVIRQVLKGERHDLRK